MPTSVYISSGGHPGSAPGDLQPAYRAWADALILKCASEAGEAKQAAAAIRATAAIARIEPISSYNRELSIDTSSFLSATSSDLLGLYFPPRWSEDLLDHLSDRRFDRDLVEELVLPCSAPLVEVHVSKMTEVLVSTPSDILNTICAFFNDDIDSYVKSLGRQPRAKLSEDWEIIVPESDLK